MLLKEAWFTAQTVAILPGLSTAEGICSWRSFGRSQLLYLLELIISWKLFLLSSALVKSRLVRGQWRSDIPWEASYDHSIVPLNEDLMYFEWKTESVFHPFWVREKQKHKRHSAFSPWIHFCRAAGLWQQSSLHKANHFHKLQEGWWGYLFLSLFGHRNNSKSVLWEVLTSVIPEILSFTFQL